MSFIDCHVHVLPKGFDADVPPSVTASSWWKRPSPSVVTNPRPFAGFGAVRVDLPVALLAAAAALATALLAALPAATREATTGIAGFAGTLAKAVGDRGERRESGGAVQRLAGFGRDEPHAARTAVPRVRDDRGEQLRREAAAPVGVGRSDAVDHDIARRREAIARGGRDLPVEVSDPPFQPAHVQAQVGAQPGAFEPFAGVGELCGRQGDAGDRRAELGELLDESTSALHVVLEAVDRLGRLG